MDAGRGTLVRWTLWAAIAATAAACASASAAAPESAGSALRSATAGEPAAAIRQYWTPRRMRHARAADLAVRAAGEVVRPGPGAGRRPRPASRSAVDSSAGSSSFPASVHGKVFFTVSAGSQPGDYVCSATAVRSNRHTLVWTAGHCVNDAQFGGGFAGNWTFVPGYRHGERPFGEWPAARLLTTSAWADRADIRQDLGAARLARDANGRGIEDAVGARPIAFKLSRSQHYVAFGYPAQPTLFEPGFDGQRLYTCDSDVTASDNPPGDGPETVEIACDMTGGASGGGWVNGSGAVNGLTSYGYELDFQHLYGPYFGAEARRLYERASGRRLLCGGERVTNLGGAGADDLSGGDSAEAFKLGGGADRARGFGGDDLACGGGGADRLKGGAGADILRGGPGRDVLNGGPGIDLCIGGPGRDRAPGCERRRRVP